MERYANRGGNSNVDSYSFTHDSITVRFTDRSEYLYTNQSAGASNVGHMKELAAAGQGLHSFINLYVKHGYAKKSQATTSRNAW